MQRRNFIQKTSILGGLLGIPLSSLCSGYNKDIFNKDERKTIEKVKLALLSMQRVSWEQGVAAQAFLELGEHEFTYLLAKDAALRQNKEGRLAVVFNEPGITNPATSGQAVLHASKATQDQELENAADRMIKYLLKEAPKSKKGILYHVKKKPEIWIDSMYTAPPFIAAAGHYYEAIKQIRGIRKALWNKDEKLFSHRWDEEKKVFINEKFWGVGNGWALAGICSTARLLPEKMKKEKEELHQYIIDCLEGCLKYIRNDFLFHNIMNDTSTFIETNFPQMMSYTIFRGITEKWLNIKYLKYALRMRQAVYKKVDRHGFVQDVCGAPRFRSPGRAAEGQAFFLLMEAAYRDMKNKR